MTAIANFQYKPGTDFVRILTLRSNGAYVDLTGYTAKMQIRAEKRRTSVLFCELSTANSKIVITPGAIPEQMLLTIPNTETENFTWQLGYYDLILTSGGGQELPILDGVFTEDPAVTELP